MTTIPTISEAAARSADRLDRTLSGVAITVTRNFGPLDEIDLVTREDWGRIGRLARERIVRRTQAGRDEHDQPFRPYSEAYAEQKVEAGASGRVDLQLSGEMLRAITVEPDDEGVTLSFVT